jgi:SAM-dependent methyltransferase
MPTLASVMERQRWSGIAQTYQRSFARLCAGTVDTIVADLGSPRARRLVDVGCGVGSLSRLAAELGWSVTAVDADIQMLTAARKDCAGLAIGWVHAALPRLGLRTESFDAAAANFVINHVPNPRAGIRELARAVRPGGVVALTVWVSQKTAHTTLFTAALQAAQAEPVPSERLPAELDFERTPDGLATLCHESGLEPVKTREITWEWPVFWDALWAGISGGIGSMGQTYLAQDPATQERIRQQLRQRTVALETDGKIRLRSVAAYVLARRSNPSQNS